MRPKVAAFFNRSRVTEKSLSHLGPPLGTISLLQKSSGGLRYEPVLSKILRVKTSASLGS